MLEKISPFPWKREFMITGTARQIIVISSTRLPEGGYYEVCRQEIEGEPKEAVERIKKDFALMEAAPALLTGLQVIANFTPCQCKDHHGDNKSCPVLIAETAINSIRKE